MNYDSLSLNEGNGSAVRKVGSVLIVGGRGETGRTILKYLASTYPELDIAVAGRTPPEESGRCRFIRMDLDGAVSPETFREFSLVIVACGPMEKLLPAVLELCIEAGTDVIDINDSAATAVKVLGLHEKARAKGVRIYSGMGMSPGISSLMLREVSEGGLSEKGVYRTRICMGTAYGGGPSSPYAMLDNLVNDIPVYRDGKVEVVRNPWNDENSGFRFFGKKKSLTTVPYSTPEIYSLSSERYRSGRACVNTYDIRCTMEGFPVYLARMIALINRKGRFSDVLASVFYKSGLRCRNSPKADPDNQIVVYPDDCPEKGIVLFGDVSSYDLTAAMAVSVADCVISGRLNEEPGVYMVELLSAESAAAVKEALRKRNFFWKSVQEVKSRKFDEWGWLERDASRVETLRHFGENWYTVKIHPRMSSVQTDILYSSELWRKIRSSCSFFGTCLFAARVLFRWKKYGYKLRTYVNRGKEYGALVRDLSMFAAGYSLAGEKLGKAEALRLYRQMFMTSGSSEMCWFLPRPETFASFRDGGKGILIYFKAMMERNQQCGFLKLGSRTDTDGNGGKITVFEIRSCIYAEIFTELGYPELADFIRVEEKNELARIAADSGLSYEFRLLGEGNADILFYGV